MTPSKASNAKALMAELPVLPPAEKMARSTMQERDSYLQKIAAVTARVSQLQADATGCSDAEIEALRHKYENQIADALGLTKEEMAMMNDEKTPDAVRERIGQKIIERSIGMNGSTMDKLKALENMSEKEQEAYIRAHPELINEMAQMSANATAFNNKIRSVGQGARTMEQELGKLTQSMANQEKEELDHNYDALARKYTANLKSKYNQIFSTNDAAKVDALYAEADKMVYNYRLEAAREYRASLERRINNSAHYVSEYNRIASNAVASGDIPQCAVGRADLNGVIYVANVLEEAYSSLPDLDVLPVQEETLYELPQGWTFSAWECRGYVGGFGQDGKKVIVK